jgi:hypothetical protein
LSSKQGVELGLTLSGSLEECASLYQLNLTSTVNGSEGRKRLVVGGEHLGADVDIVTLDERVHGLVGEERPVESLERGQEDLAGVRLARFARADDLVVDKGQELADQLDLRFGGSDGLDGVAFVVEFLSDNLDQVGIASDRVVKFFTNDLGRDPCFGRRRDGDRETGGSVLKHQGSSGGLRG